MRATQPLCVLLAGTTATALAPAPSLSSFTTPLRSATVTTKSPALRRSGTVVLQQQFQSYEEYLAEREQANGQAQPTNMPPNMPPQMPRPMPPPDAKFISAANYRDMVLAGPASDTDENYDRVPWWRQSSDFTEAQRKDRRTVFMHDDWVRHRSSDRFFRNLKNIASSGINQALSKELAFVSLCATFVVLSNMAFSSYQDLSGVSHPGPLSGFPLVPTLSLPTLPFTVASPALSLLLVFRTNTGYSRWNEARTLWGGLINTCRNVVRQANGFFPNDEMHNMLKRRLASETGAFIRALRNFLRGPTDDDNLRNELYEMVQKGEIPLEEANNIMAATNRPMYCLSAMTATLRKAEIPEMHSARIDASISTLVDLTGANERIFKSPIPLVYTRLLSRFLSTYLILLPLALWGALGDSWNHWATIPAEFLIAFFLFGIEEVGIQIEEPFSVLPLEAFCNGAITATYEEMLKAEREEAFEGGF